MQAGQYWTSYPPECFCSESVPTKREDMCTVLEERNFTPDDSLDGTEL
jgi:hypothetical protein